MSRIGKLPVEIPDGVVVTLNDTEVKVKGKLGELAYNYSREVLIEKIDNKISIKPKNLKNKKARALWGLNRSLVNNMVIGVSKGFNKVLEINGVGFRAAIKGKILTLFLGYSHEIKYLVPENIEVKCPKPTTIEIFSADKAEVGQFAADIMRLRKIDPYKGKGVRFEGQVIQTKEGKKK